MTLNNLTNKKDFLHNKIQYKEAHWRSMAKSISWRITGSLDTLILSWIITGEFKFAISIASAEVITKIILFYLHERIWDKIKIGKKVVPPPDYQI
jgi:uncharacterized membrane protein